MMKNTLLKEYVNGNPSVRKYYDKNNSRTMTLKKIKKPEKIIIKKDHRTKYEQPILPIPQTSNNENYIFETETESNSIIGNKTESESNSIIGNKTESNSNGSKINDGNISDANDENILYVDEIDSRADKSVCDTIDEILESFSINNLESIQHISDENIKNNGEIITDNNKDSSSKEIEKITDKLIVYEKVILLLTAEIQKNKNITDKLLKAVKYLQLQHNNLKK